MKNRKKLFIPLLGLSIMPMVYVTSCSQTDDPYKEIQNSQTLFAAFSNDIKVSINKNNITLSELTNDMFSFSVTDQIANNPDSAEYCKKINNAIAESKIEFLDYYLPKLNEDNQTYILFTINKDMNQIVKYPVSKLFFENSQFTVKNFSANELKNEIGKKINENANFVCDLEGLIKNKLISNFINDNDSSISFIDYWNKYLNNDAIELIKNFLNDNYYCFDLIFGNINISQPFNIIVTENKVKFSFKVSTIPLNENPDCTYEIFPLTFWL